LKYFLSTSSLSLLTPNPDEQRCKAVMAEEVQSMGTQATTVVDSSSGSSGDDRQAAARVHGQVEVEGLIRKQGMCL